MAKKRQRSGKAEAQVVIVKKKAKEDKDGAESGDKKENRRLSSQRLADPTPRLFNKAANMEKFLAEEDGKLMKDCIQWTYCGFESEMIKNRKLHEEMALALNKLTEEGYFHYDCVQYGERVNITRVQRVLVGTEGITYLYQKLRLFALPWTDNKICDGALTAIHKLNVHLQQRSNDLIKKKAAQGGHVAASAGVGSAQFNLTLINAALTNRKDKNTQDGNENHPPLQPVLPFKPDTRFEQEKALAVNWHKDSTLEPFSTIAVYQHTPDSQSSDWEIAMCCERQKTAPPVRKSLRDGECYFMLGNFNHQHMHAVVAGSSARYASTHRVALTQDATYESILKRCEKASEEKKWSTKRPPSELTSDHIRLIGETDNILEFQWIRMFYCQGAIHERQHKSWWTPRIESLERMWLRFEKQLAAMIKTAMEFSTSKNGKPDLKAYKMLVYILESKQSQREEWAKRLQDPTYRRLPKQYRPINRPDCTSTPTLPFDLSDVLMKLREALVLAHPSP